MFLHQNHDAGGGNGSIMVGMFVFLCLASQNPFRAGVFCSRQNDLGVNLLTLSPLGAPLVRLLESSVHKSAYSGPINMIPSAKWVCYVLPIHVACSIMQIGPLVPKIQQVTRLRGR
jgi:hypothetical protein